MTAMTPAEVFERYRSATPGSGEHFEHARTVLPDGLPAVLSHFPHHPLYIERADGCYLYDVDGRPLLDLISSNHSLLLGHNHPVVAAAIRRQLDKGMHFQAASANISPFAQLIVDRVPSIDKVRFTASGSESTMFAIRLARAYTGRQRLLRMKGSYHGLHEVASVGFGSSAGVAGSLRNGRPVPNGVPPALADDVEFAEYNDLDECRALFDAYPREFAAVMVEPVLGTSGSIPSEDGFLAGLRQLCDATGTVLIFDEMITMGMGRAGGQGHYGVLPDLTTTGKSLGGGMPLGLFGGRADIMALCERVDDGIPVMHGGTYAAHPLSAAAGTAALELLTDDVYDDNAAMGEYTRTAVRDLAQRRRARVQVTGVRHLVGLHYTDVPVRNYADSITEDPMSSRVVFASMLADGVYMPFDRICINAAHTKEDIDVFLTAFERALEAAGLVGN
jgi:glutamate-1-semialdehyde 2,1-aminomutase